MGACFVLCDAVHVCAFLSCVNLSRFPVTQSHRQAISINHTETPLSDWLTSARLRPACCPDAVRAAEQYRRSDTSLCWPRRRRAINHTQRKHCGLAEAGPRSSAVVPWPKLEADIDFTPESKQKKGPSPATVFPILHQYARDPNPNLQPRVFQCACYRLSFLTQLGFYQAQICWAGGLVWLGSGQAGLACGGSLQDRCGWGRSRAVPSLPPRPFLRV